MEFHKSKTDSTLLSPIANINYTLTTKSNKKLENTIDSPKNINFTGIHTHSINPMTTNNSLGLNMKKFSITNNHLATNFSKIGSTNSSISMSRNNPITNYISCSTLQSGVASYTIPREKRFTHNYRNASCNSIYNLPEFKRTGVTMPQSTRKDSFVKKDLTPSSQDYVFTSLFDDNLKFKRGISISTKHSIKVKKNFKISLGRKNIFPRTFRLHK